MGLKQEQSDDESHRDFCNKEFDSAVAEATAQRKAENAEYTKTVQANSIAIELINKAKNRLNKFYNPALYKEAPKREMTDEDRATLAAGGTVDLTIAEPVRTGPYVFAQIREHHQSKTQQPGPQPEIFEGKYENK